MGVGASVTLSGTVGEYSNVTILLGLTDFEILGASDNGIEPSLVSTGEISTGGDNSEAFEGVLVRVEGTCDNDDFGYGEWSLDDGSGPVRVDDFIYDEFMPVLGTSYQVTGILFYSYGEFKILPRDENDIVEILSVDENSLIPGTFSLLPAYPNPFNPTTTIRFSVGIPAGRDNTSLQIYDITGRLVETFVIEQIESGYNEILWNARNLPSGVYFIHLRFGDKSKSQKVIYLK